MGRVSPVPRRSFTQPACISAAEAIPALRDQPGLFWRAGVPQATAADNSLARSFRTMDCAAAASPSPGASKVYERTTPPCSSMSFALQRSVSPSPAKDFKTPPASSSHQQYTMAGALARPVQDGSPTCPNTPLS